MQNRKINIVIADSSTIISEGLRNIIQSKNSYFNIDYALNMQSIDQLSYKKKIDIVIINPFLVHNCNTVFSNLKKEMPQTKWFALVYSYFDNNFLMSFDSIIYINDSKEDIYKKIIKITEMTKENDDSHYLILTEREIEVLKLLVEGNANKEIADKLNISTHTVITHRKNITQKTGIKTVSGLTIYAVVKKIITLE